MMNSKQDGTAVSRKFTLRGTPWWAWIFAASTIVIPMVSAGGAIPALLGIGGFVLIIRTSQSDKTLLTKLLLCFGITVGAWALFALMVGALANLLF
jgi:hypothetical protein